MVKSFDGRRREFAFVRVEPTAPRFSTLHHHLQLSHMQLGGALREHDDVVQVHEARFQRESSKVTIHHSLELARLVRQIKWHADKTEQTFTGRERRLVAVFRGPS